MRDVMVGLASTARGEVACVLDEPFIPQENEQWLGLGSDGDPVLYIEFYDLKSYADEDELKGILRDLGVFPAVSAIAGASGRQPGEAEAREFVRMLLSRFKRVAYDDDSDLAWTLEEIDAGLAVEGTTFFDRRRA